MPLEFSTGSPLGTTEVVTLTHRVEELESELQKSLDKGELLKKPCGGFLLQNKPAWFMVLLLVLVLVFGVILLVLVLIFMILGFFFHFNYCSCLNYIYDVSSYGNSFSIIYSFSDLIYLTTT